MENTDVLFLHGSPGSGKTTLARNDLDKIRDFLVSTHEISEEDAAREVIEKAGWLVARQ